MIVSFLGYMGVDSAATRAGAGTRKVGDYGLKPKA